MDDALVNILIDFYVSETSSDMGSQTWTWADLFNRFIHPVTWSRDKMSTVVTTAPEKVKVDDALQLRWYALI